MERFGGDGKASPVTNEHLLGQRSIVFLEGWGLAQGNQQVKGSVLAHVVQQFDGEVFDIGHHEGALVLGRGQDLFSQLKQLLGGGTELARTTGVG